MKMPAALLVTITANVINGPDALELSVLNEIEHALDRAPVVTNVVLAASFDFFATNGLSDAEVAVRLVSLQKADGTWNVDGTNRTREAVAILESLVGRRTH